MTYLSLTNATKVIDWARTLVSQLTQRDAAVDGLFPVSVANGGTGGTSAASARSGIGAAASGANSDITSLTGLTTPLAVAEGGTGATTAAGARSDLGLGTMATQNANAVAITGGSVTGLTAPLTTTGFAYLADETANTVTLANGGVQGFPAFSGLIIVNDQSVTGRVVVFIVGNGVGTLGNTGSSPGTMTFDAPNSRYIFTNTTGSTATFSFLALQTRHST